MNLQVQDLPALNAIFNASAGACLCFGFWAVKQKRINLHRMFMAVALIFSAVFLVSYLYYHSHTEVVTKYHGLEIFRYPYYLMLITHIILAMVIVPGALVALFWALRRQFERHKRVTRWLWPVWMYVSVTGVIIYMVLYKL